MHDNWDDVGCTKYRDDKQMRGKKILVKGESLYTEDWHIIFQYNDNRQE